MNACDGNQPALPFTFTHPPTARARAGGRVDGQAAHGMSALLIFSIRYRRRQRRRVARPPTGSARERRAGVLRTPRPTPPSSRSSIWSGIDYPVVIHSILETTFLMQMGRPSFFYGATSLRILDMFKHLMMARSPMVDATTTSTTTTWWFRHHDESNETQ